MLHQQDVQINAFKGQEHKNNAKNKVNVRKD